MLSTNAQRGFPIFDDFGLLRAIVHIRPGREFESTQLARRVVVAVSFALGEKVNDWSRSTHEKASAEITRLISHRPLGFEDEFVGVMEIADAHESFVLIAVYRNRERECQVIATLVNATVSGFLHRQTQVLAYEL